MLAGYEDDDIQIAKFQAQRPKRLNFSKKRSSNSYSSAPRHPTQSSAPRHPTQSRRECTVCKAADRRYFGHTFMECDYLSKVEKREMIKVCRSSIHDNDINEVCGDFDSFGTSEQI